MRVFMAYWLETRTNAGDRGKDAGAWRRNRGFLALNVSRLRGLHRNRWLD
jgi:hypothetical protein